MPARQTCAIAFLLTIASLSAFPGPSRAVSGLSLDAAIARLKQGQQLRIKTSDQVMLRGRFLLVKSDSIYFEMRFEEEKSSGSPEVRTMVGVGHSQVDELWAFEPRGVRRGLLWAGGTALLGTALMFAGGGDNTEDVIFITTVTIIAVPVAFIWGAYGKRETIIYSRE